LAEVGYGVFNQVHQYAVAKTAVNGLITGLQVWPSGTNPYIPNVSGGVNDATDGNGGYNSGGDVRDVIGCTISGTVSIYGVSGTTDLIDTVSGTTIQIASYLGLTDAASGNAAGHVDLSYNGVPYSSTGVQNGSYTFWGYEHLMYVGTLSGANNAVRAGIEANINAALTTIGSGTQGTNNSPGLGLGTMSVSRSTDGGLVGP
jgi:hypothetical protein